MINSDCMYECEWCRADLGSDPKAYDEHIKVCEVRLKEKPRKINVLKI